jgi:segregation and condensation protein B
MVENYTGNTQFSLISQIEALLFIASGLTSITQLAETLNVKASEIESGLEQLQSCYEQDRGLRLIWHSGRVELTTKPGMSEIIEKFLGLDTTTKLSRAGLETLTIIAYRQPITRPTIDSIRGVNSDGVIKSLLSKGLITEFDRANTPGRPILFGTTEDFLLHFGLNSIEELPPYISDEQTNNDIQNGMHVLKD